MADTVFLNGTYLAKEEARVSPDDRGFLFADGVYEVLRSYRGTFFAEDAHFTRLASGLHALRIDGADPAALRQVCRELLRRNGLERDDATVYLQVTRGAARRIHAFPTPTPAPTVYVAAQAFRAKHNPATGVKAITVPDMRWARCDIKSVCLLPNVLANQQAAEAGAAEAIFVRDGVALEGTHTSFFAVVDGVVRTAPRTNYILPSVTRAIVLQLCREDDIRCEESPVFLDEARRAEELMAVGTTFEAMPITHLDDQPVGTGKPGPVSRRLLELFHALVR